MHEVICPKCQRILRLPHAVARARLKCNHCQTVFEASSQPAAPKAGAGQTPHRRTAPQRRRSSTPAVVATLVGTLVVVALVIIGGYLYMNPYVRLLNADGTVHWEGRVRLSERDRIIAEHEQRRTPSAPQADPAGNETPVASRQPQPQRPAATPPQKPETPPDRPQPAQLARDPRIRVEGLEAVHQPGAANSGHVVAVLSNDSRETVRSLQLQFVLYNSSGAKLSLPVQTVQWIPPESRVHVSARFAQVPQEEIARVDYEVTRVQADPSMVCTLIELTYDYDKRQIQGHVNYNGSRAIRSPGLYVTFLGDKGEILSDMTVDQVLDDGGRLRPGGYVYISRKVNQFVFPNRVQARLFGPADAE